MHKHMFREEEWPFADPISVAAITTRHILDGSLPILLVTHDSDDGGWQVLCGTTNEPDDGRVACLGCLFERDRSLAEVADLPLGWRAWRDSPQSTWVRAQSDDDGG
jgi:hypothetical protein